MQNPYQPESGLVGMYVYTQRVKSCIAGETEDTQQSVREIGFPPLPSSSGKKYYVFKKQHPGGDSIICGAPLALELLGGQWFGHGTCPSGSY